VVLHGLNYEVLAVVILLQQRLTVNLVDEIILAEQGKPDVLHEGGKVLCPSFHRVLNPGDNALKHLFLIWNSDGVTGNQSTNLLWPEAIELVTLKHLCKMSLYV